MPYAEKRTGEYPWSVKYKLANGRYRRASGFPTEKAALDHGREQEADIRRGLWQDAKTGRITLDAYWQKWLPGYDVSDNARANRIAQYRNHIKPRWGNTALADVDPFDVQVFDKEKHAALSKSYADGIMELLRMLFNDAVFAGLIRMSPVRAASRSRRREPDTARKGRVTDLATLDAVRARLAPGTSLMFLLIVFTGMRWGEATGVRRSFLTLLPATRGRPARGHYVIDKDVGAVHEDKQGRRFFGPPKFGKGRTIELPPFLVEQLLAYLETIPRQRDLLFVDSVGQPHHRSNFNRRTWRPACDGWPERDVQQGHAALFEAPAVALGLVTHDLRHTHKTWLADDGIEPVARDERLGHVTPGMDGVYIHTTPAMRAKILAALQSRWEQHQASTA